MKCLFSLGLAIGMSLGAARVAADEVVPPLQGGQTAADEQSASLYQASTPFRLLDPSRLSMHHSYSLAYFSGSGGGQSVGMYMNSIGYQLAKPLYLQVDLGLVHNPGALVGSGSPADGARILPNFSLRYTPSQKFTFMVDVRTLPTYYSPYAGYRPGYGNDFWLR
jgi:hypothetical protein